MTNANVNPAPNQFIITGENFTVFQSYSTIIAFQKKEKTYLDVHAFDYSKTTSKYLNQFLNKTKKETLEAIEAGTIILANLNPKV